jgi:hypothetical protein
MHFSRLALILMLVVTVCVQTAHARVYVATNGSDGWSGTLAAPNPKKTDGPFATIQRARDVLRLNAPAAGRSAKQIIVRGGTYYLAAPLVLTPQDSGLSIAAYHGERPVISGGKSIAGWKKSGRLWTAKANWDFRQLRVGNQSQTLARTPNFDAARPTTGGWSFIAQRKVGIFGSGVGGIHTPGDWIEWKINAPATGDYKMWLFYGAENKPFGSDNMAGHYSVSVDGAAPVTLQNLPDTGGWNTFRWNNAATLALSKGAHTLRWTNNQGGGLNWDAFALSDDTAWQPSGTDLKPPAEDKHLVVVQAETFHKAQSKDMNKVDVPSPAYTDHFSYRAGDIAPYPRSPHPEIHIFPAWGWVNTVLAVSKIDPETRTVWVEKNRSASEELRDGNRYFVSNVFEALDQPGEWWREEKTDTVYLWPRSETFVQQPVVAPVLDRLIDFQGDAAGDKWVENVTIKGFELRDTTYSREISVYGPEDAAIWMSGARRCVVENNRFLGVGGYALHLQKRSENNEFVGNEVAFNGQGGVFLGGEVKDQPHHNLIAGNWIHDGGTIYKHVAGVYCTSSSGNRIAHNRIERMPRYAISMKGGNATFYSHNNIVEYNDLRMTNLETNDTGAIECLGREKMDSGNVIQFNRITDIVGLKTASDGEILSPYMTWAFTWTIIRAASW